MVSHNTAPVLSVVYFETSIFTRLTVHRVNIRCSSPDLYCDMGTLAQVLRRPSLLSERPPTKDLRVLCLTFKKSVIGLPTALGSFSILSRW